MCADAWKLTWRDSNYHFGAGWLLRAFRRPRDLMRNDHEGQNSPSDWLVALGFCRPNLARIRTAKSHNRGSGR